MLKYFQYCVKFVKIALLDFFFVFAKDFKCKQHFNNICLFFIYSYFFIFLSIFFKILRMNNSQIFLIQIFLFQPFHLWYREKELLDSNARISKALALIYGFICLGVALLIRNYESLLTTCLVVFGIIGGPLFAVFTAGIMIPLANQFVRISNISFIRVIFGRFSN